MVRRSGRRGAAWRGGRSHLMVLLGVRPCRPSPLDPNPNLMVLLGVEPAGGLEHGHLDRGRDRGRGKKGKALGFGFGFGLVLGSGFGVGTGVGVGVRVGSGRTVECLSSARRCATAFCSSVCGQTAD